MRPSKPTKPPPRHAFKFEKRGLQGSEFEDCLTSKVDKLLEGIKLKRIKTLKGDAIKDVRREVCIRENKSKPGLDQRPTRANKNFRRKRRHSETESDCDRPFSESERDQERILRGKKDTPMRHKEVPVPEGERKLDKLWIQIYHEEQSYLFSHYFLKIDDLRNLLPGIKLNRKGNLIRRGSESWNELNSIQFCNEIDKISVFFFKKLRELCLFGNRETFRLQWEMTLKSVSKSCKKILLYRNAVDWCIDNDLMSENYNVWKDHVMVMISFSALMVVTKMLCKKLEFPRKKKRFRSRTLP